MYISSRTCGLRPSSMTLMPFQVCIYTTFAINETSIYIIAGGAALVICR